MMRTFARDGLAVGIAASAFFLVIFLHQVIFNIARPLRDHDDLTGHYFLFENDFTKLLNLDFQNFFEARLYYPLKHSLAFRNSFLGQSLLGLPVYFVTRDVIVSSNTVILIDFFLSFLGTYLLAFRLTRSKTGAIIAGVVYAYNPYVMAHPHHEQMVGQWIPFAFLLGEELLTRRRARTYMFLWAVSLLQFSSSFYYTMFLVVTWPLYVGIRMAQKHMSMGKLWHPVLLPLAIVAAFFGQWYLRPYREIANMYNVTRSLRANEVLSARFSDFLFTHPDNILFGWMNTQPFLRSLRDPYAAFHPAEHSLFPGLTALGMLTLSILLLWKRKFGGERKQYTIAFLILLITTAILSFGPVISLGNNIRIPGPYVLYYRLIPFAPMLRAPSRFVVTSFLSLAILTSLAWERVWNHRPKQRWLLFAAVIVILSVEYQHRFGSPFVVSPEIRQFYAWLDRQDSIHAVVELPIGNDLDTPAEASRSSLADSQYLLYGIYHHKYLVNGNSSFIPPDVLELGALLTFSFPAPSTVKLLQDQHVDAVTVHREEFTDLSTADRLIKKIETYGLKRLYHSEFIDAFSLRGKEER